MRLTLRTLLAYLDDILEPADADELAAKIHESEFASGLVHRIRSAMGRLRLGSPAILGEGMGRDPNSVAEYLDNTMGQEFVPELEKICLESDEHLAEVAACHQVLTLVLGEPASVAPALRKRMYSLNTGTMSETAAAAADVMQKSVVPGTGPMASHDEVVEHHYAALASRSSPTVATDPYFRTAHSKNGAADYLVAGRKSSWIPLVAALLAGFAIMGGFLALRPHWSPPGKVAVQDPSQLPPVENILPQHEMTVQDLPVEAPPLIPSDPEKTTPIGAGDLSEEPFDVNGASADGELDANGELAPANAAAAKPPASPPLAVDSPMQPATDTIAVDTADQGRAAEFPVGIAPPGANPELPPAPTAASEAANPLKEAPATIPAEPAPNALASSDQLSMREGGTAVKSLPESNVPDLADAAPAEPVPAEPQLTEIGAFISRQDVLAVAAESGGGWNRFEPRARLEIGQKFRSISAYRPQLLFSSGVQVTMVGMTELDVVPPSRDQVPNVRVPFGRLVAMSVSTDKATVTTMDVTVSDYIVSLMLNESGSELALEVVLPVGETQVPQIQLWSASGTNGVAVNGGPSVQLETGQRVVLEDGKWGPPANVSRPPSWVDEANLTEVLRNATQDLANRLDLDRPLSLTLKENAQDRDPPDRRSLATRGLAALDIYGPLVEALGDIGQRSYWDGHIEALQQTLKHGRDSVEKLSQTLGQRYAQNGPLILEMLQVESDEQVRESAAKLVTALDDDELAVRVTAFRVLQDLTGVTLTYRPDYSRAKRRNAVKSWNRKLEDGEIVRRLRPAE